MNDPSEREELLADVLGESQPPDFRAAVLDETLRLARRRRKFRSARRVGATGTALIAIVGLGSFVWKISSSDPVPALPPRFADYELIRTQPLPAQSVVHTQPLATTQMVASAATIETIHTSSAGDALRIIDDRQLLALVAPRPAALIRVGPQTERLIFADEANSEIVR